jgi:hypothetical protein
MFERAAQASPVQYGGVIEGPPEGDSVPRDHEPSPKSPGTARYHGKWRNWLRRRPCGSLPESCSDW